MRALTHLNKYLFRYKYRLILGTIFIVITNVFGIMPAWLVREAFDMISSSIDLHATFSGFLVTEMRATVMKSLSICALLLVSGVCVRGIFLFLMRRTIIVMSRYIEYDLRNEIYACYQKLPLSFYSKKSTGDLLARISEDVSRVRMCLGPVLMYGINLITLLLILVPVMFSINAKLAAYSLLPLPFLSISIYCVNNFINKRSERIQAQLSVLSTFTQEAFSGIRVIQSYAREDFFYEQFTAANKVYKQRSMSLVLVESLFFPLILLLVGVSVVLTIYVGALEVLEGRSTIGNIAEFILYMGFLTWPVTSLGWAVSLLQRAAASQARINEYLHEPNPIATGTQAPVKLMGSISFEGVSFTHQTRQVLSDISFSISSGQSLAIVGKIGSGKTTLLQLICRLHDPATGCILLDNLDLKQYDITYLRSKIGYVPQDIFLFSDTIAANIAFGYAEATQAEIRVAAEAASLTSTIDNLPYGLNTVVGERGVRLSGGQKQRVAIARALVRKPRLLILDDCLSAVDTSTEHQILRNLATHISSCTTLIVSHRASSVKLADLILVLDQGYTRAFGTHQELLHVNDYYRDFCKSQLTDNHA